MKIKYDINLMKYISVFSSVTKADVKDCIQLEDKLLFVVEASHIAKAIGKQGANIKKLTHLLKKKVKVIEFSPDVAQFIRNYLYPIQPTDIKEDDGTITVSGKDTKERGIMIGRDRSNLNQLKEVVSRYFSFTDIRVV